MTRMIVSFLLAAFLLVAGADAQFNLFEQMFQQGGQQQQRHEPHNVASDSRWYQENYDNARCDQYLCPDTLACVSVPAHCPCAHPVVEDKVELGNGKLCISKGGFKAGEAARKIELARKGLL